MSIVRKKLYKGKITIKLSILIFGMFVILASVIMAAQILYFNRIYLTTDYTKQREKSLNMESRQFFYYYTKEIMMDNQSSILDGLNGYTSKNQVYAILIDGDGNIIKSSTNTTQLKEEYVESTQERIKRFQFNDDLSRSFRIKTRYGFPTEYIAVAYGSNVSDYIKPVYLVSITKEVYTNENYFSMMKFSIYLLILILILAMITAYLFSSYITKPVLEIMDVATHISKLDFSKKCKYKKLDELGVLAQNLNEMSDILNQTITQLEKANKRLEEDMEMQKVFIADASHEFKTPLTIIRGFIEILEYKRDNQVIQEEAMHAITCEVDRMDKLVYDLLKLSKLESQTYELSKQNINCAKMLENIADSYEILMKNKGIVFLREYNEIDDNIMADQYSIEQVIRNFISNAITYTQPQEKIILSAKSNNNHIQISVFNEGAQIEEFHLDKIWNKFYRIDKARSKDIGGTGLGLSICKRILDLHGYEYGVMNMDNGVVFYFKAEIAL